MVDRRGLALAVVLVSLAPAASAQDYCEQYPWSWSCRGPWARPAPPPGWQQRPPQYAPQPQYQPQPQYRPQPSWRAPPAPARPRETAHTPLDPESARQYAAVYAAIED